MTGAGYPPESFADPTLDTMGDQFYESTVSPQDMVQRPGVVGLLREQYGFDERMAGIMAGRAVKEDS